MAQSFNIERVATTTTTEASSQAVAVHEVAPNIVYLDRTATINGALTLIGRTKITRETSGGLQRDNIQYLDFSSTIATFTAAAVTTPFSDAEADRIIDLGTTPWINVSAIYTANGDTAGA